MYDVVIIGGGPVGLSTSILLSMHGIKHVLFEKHPSTSIHPKACGLNQRTIEIFRRMGIEKDFLDRCAPSEISGRTAWYTSFGPEGREIVSRDAWGGGQFAQTHNEASPCPYVVAPQIRFEPILRRRALELKPGCLQFNSEVIGLEELGDHNVLKIRQNGNVTMINARYCIVADGGRSFTDDLGIGWEGERDLMDMVAVHIHAPISRHNPDNRNFITWFINPALGGSIGTGYIYHLGPYPVKPETEEWLFACALNPEDPKKFDKDYVLQRLHNTLQIPELEIQVLSFSHWQINAITAQRYRSKPRDGRVFLVGDAAHRIPPYGGLGLNTGVQDAYNLVWKLSFALQPPCQSVACTYSSLLDSYGEERKPIAERVARSGLHNVRSHAAVIDKAIGILPGNSREENIAAVNAFFNAKDDDTIEANQAALQQAQKVLDCEFNALGAEVGWFYPTLDKSLEGQKTCHGGQVDTANNFDTMNYFPSTIPGHHLPHAWISKNEIKISTLDLMEIGRFLLISHVANLWEPLLDDVGDLVHIHTIVPADIKDSSGSEQWTDVNGTWNEVRGVQEDGAVLVRPDGMVVWRGQDKHALEHVNGQTPSMQFKELIENSLMLENNLLLAK